MPGSPEERPIISQGAKELRDAVIRKHLGKGGGYDTAGDTGPDDCTDDEERPVGGWNLPTLGGSEGPPTTRR